VRQLARALQELALERQRRGGVDLPRPRQRLVDITAALDERLPHGGLVALLLPHLDISKE